MENQEFINKQHVEKLVEDHRSKEWEKLEKILLTVAGGTLAATTTIFVSKGSYFTHKLILAAAWGLLSLSLVALLLSYAFVEISDSRILNQLRDPSSRIRITDLPAIINDGFRRCAEYANYGALASCIIGLIVLAVFAYLNILQ